MVTAAVLQVVATGDELSVVQGWIWIGEATALYGLEPPQ